MNRTLLLLGTSFAALYLSGWPADPWLRLILKVIPTLCLAAWVWRDARPPMLRPMGIGFLLCALGDLLLAWPTADLFVFGLAAFLVGHILFIVAFLRTGRGMRPGLSAPFVAWAVGAAAWVLPNAGEMAGPVVAYIAVICTMMWRAAARMPQAGALLCFAGAVSFGVSDSMIAINRFITPLPAERLLVMLTYWGGLALIAAGVIRGGERD